jgi:radical SAM protein with 4Fe4S-binding SPASM domain
LTAELQQLGCECITLSGGEPLLRPDWPRIAAEIRDLGMQVELITNGLCAAEQADEIRDAGFASVTFSVDGPAPVHDALRGKLGCLDAIWRGASALRERGVKLGAVTQINRLNRNHLSEVRSLLVQHGFGGWQLQLTMPHGRAGLRKDSLCLTPQELPGLEQAILAWMASSELYIQVGDNIGYMSRNEPLLRTCAGQPAGFWTGCGAGLMVLGITSDGTVRGCLSQPPADNEGNIRERSLTSIWQDPHAFAYNRKFQLEQLSGSCEGCAFGRVCRGGCRSLAWAVSPDNPRSNPYCLYRTACVVHGA